MKLGSCLSVWKQERKGGNEGGRTEGMGETRWRKEREERQWGGEILKGGGVEGIWDEGHGKGGKNDGGRKGL